MVNAIAPAAGSAAPIPPTPSLPREIGSALIDTIWATERRWSASAALAEVTRAGLAHRLPGLADQMEASLAVAEPAWLRDRLALLWLANGTGGSSGKRATAWLGEMMRLLGDLPADIVSRAIDDVVREDDQGFLPTVGAIRAAARPMIARRRDAARKLRSMVDVAGASPADVRREASSPGDRLPPGEVDEANILMRRLRLRQRYRKDGTPYQLREGDVDPASALSGNRSA